mmetsp:Transcript_3264/g.6621  ORF Transcript_3264/g.6621 Transcript_3264/m.6621 type:complete len:122 (-) Transcript_3264:248-613(-)
MREVVHTPGGQCDDQVEARTWNVISDGDGTDLTQHCISVQRATDEDIQANMSELDLDADASMHDRLTGMCISLEDLMPVVEYDEGDASRIEMASAIFTNHCRTLTPQSGTLRSCMSLSQAS